MHLFKFNHYEIANMLGFNSLLIKNVTPIIDMVTVQTPNPYRITIKLAACTDEDEEREETSRERR